MSIVCVLDTDICVDIIRKHPPSLAWLAATTPVNIGIPIYVALELIQNAKNKREANASALFVSLFELVMPTEKSSQWSLDHFADSHLAHGTGLIYILIASVAVELSVPLYSFNLRRYRNIPNLTISQPYVR
jgi:predicted nucleic acid-binding protein